MLYAIIVCKALKFQLLNAFLVNYVAPTRRSWK